MFEDISFKNGRKNQFLKITIAIIILVFVFYTSLPPNGHHFEKLKQVYNYEQVIKFWNQSKPFCSAPPNFDEMANDPLFQMYDLNVSMKCNSSKIYTKVNWEEGFVTLTQDAEIDNVICYYSYFWRFENEDNYIDYSENEMLTTEGAELTEEVDMVNVSCYNQNEQKVYINIHMWIPDLVPKVLMNNSNPPSVLVLFLESLSTLNFLHYMPLTKHALNELGNVHQLKGFVKHEDNSFPNTLSFLTGEKIDHKTEYTRFKFNYMDDVVPPVRYLWDDFDAAGYVTGFLEDVGLIGIFNINKWGWRTPPTNWYPRPFWIQINLDEEKNMFDCLSDTKYFCFDGIPKIEIYFEQILQFMIRMNQNNQPFFLFTSHLQMTHNEINFFKLVDPFFAQFFRQTKDLLNNTLVIFAGDHGSRTTPKYNHTAHGLLNARMNFVSVRVPESLDSKYPHLRKFLAANHDRLTSWLDVHQLVKDVAINNYDLQEPLIVKSGPVSPWRQLVHPDRTCDDAMINPIYCVCNGSINSGVDQIFAKMAMDAIQLYVNEKYQQWNVTFKTCIEQRVNSSLTMSYMIPSLGHSWMKDVINITTVLKPSNATYNVLVNADHLTELYSVNQSTKCEEELLEIMCQSELSAK